MLEDKSDIAFSIDLIKSQQVQSSDNHKLPLKQTSNLDKLKCFKCYGRGIKNCRECQSTQQILSSHPLALLLNSVLLKRLQINKENEPKGDQLFQKVFTIEEQEQDKQEKRLNCSNCKCQCEETCYYCSACPSLCICCTCEKKNIQDKHQLIRSKVYSAFKADLSIVDQIKKCCNCRKDIENYYSSCKTCLERGLKFWVCDLCSDHKTYTHSPSHVLETVKDDNSLRDNQLQTTSQKLQFQDKSTYLEKDGFQPNFHSQQDQLQHHLMKMNSSIDYFVQRHDQTQIPLSPSNKYDETNQKNSYVSRVKFDLNEGLFSSYYFSMENNQTMRQSLSPLKLNYIKQQKSRQSQKENLAREQYCTGYRCDLCGIEPIKNVRYHCTTCEDFDVCEYCFERCIRTHGHITFDKIDHQQVKKKAINRIIHLKDSNLKASSYLVRKNSQPEPLLFSSINA